MPKRQKLFTIEESVADRLDKQVGTGYRSGFVERAIRARLDESAENIPEQVSLRWLYIQLLLHDEASIEIKNLARWYINGNRVYEDKNGMVTVFDPEYYKASD